LFTTFAQVFLTNSQKSEKIFTPCPVTTYRFCPPEKTRFFVKSAQVRANYRETWFLEAQRRPPLHRLVQRSRKQKTAGVGSFESKYKAIGGNRASSIENLICVFRPGLSKDRVITKLALWSRHGPCAQILFGAKAVLRTHRWPKTVESVAC
jgi:hypothetical protein